MYGQPCADTVDLYRGQRKGIGTPSVPFSCHVSGEDADGPGGARPDGRLCTPDPGYINKLLSGITNISDKALIAIYTLTPPRRIMDCQ